MKVRRYSKEFQPIEIILESEDEVKDLQGVLDTALFQIPYNPETSGVYSFCKTLEYRLKSLE